MYRGAIRRDSGGLMGLKEEGGDGDRGIGESINGGHGGRAEGDSSSRILTRRVYDKKHRTNIKK